LSYEAMLKYCFANLVFNDTNHLYNHLPLPVSPRRAEADEAIKYSVYLLEISKYQSIIIVFECFVQSLPAWFLLE